MPSLLKTTNESCMSWESMLPHLDQALPAHLHRRIRQEVFDIRPFEKDADGHQVLAGVPAKLGYIHPNYLGPLSECSEPAAWLSNGSTTALHKDAFDNFVCVVAGSKHFLLYPPEDHMSLYWTPVYPKLLSWLKEPLYLTWSLVDHVGNIESPDLDTFPLFAQIAHLGIETELRAGECIYLPAGWAHKVRTRTPTLMIQYWWKKKPKAFQGLPSIFYNRSGDMIRGDANVVRHCSGSH